MLLRPTKRQSLEDNQCCHNFSIETIEQRYPNKPKKGKQKEEKKRGKLRQATLGLLTNS